MRALSQTSFPYSSVRQEVSYLLGLPGSSLWRWSSGSAFCSPRLPAILIQDGFPVAVAFLKRLEIGQLYHLALELIVCGLDLSDVS